MRLSRSLNYIGDVNNNQSDDYVEIKTKNISLLEEKENNLIFSSLNLMSPPLYEGIEALSLNEDINKDGFFEILLSIHKKEDNYFKLTGYIIRSGKTGQILEAFYQ
jgi:hypothetical protein